MTKLRNLALFTGIGGMDLGLEATGGIEPAGFVEIDPYAQLVLRKRWPEVPREQDVTQVWGDEFGAVDLISGGFPCQDISSAGKGAGITGARSSMWFQFLRIVSNVRPQYVLIENSSFLRTRGLSEVLRGLASIGYDAEWHSVYASYFGAPHRRRRLIVVAYPKRDQQPREEPCLGALGRMGRQQQSFPWDGGWEAALARFRGMDDGSTFGPHRTDAIRNAVVPQVAEAVGRCLLESAE